MPGELEIISRIRRLARAQAGVKVGILSNKIESIAILYHQNGMGKKAEGITNRVIQSQSLLVDSVSGATLSSKVILKAIEAALTPTNH